MSQIGPGQEVLRLVREALGTRPKDDGSTTRLLNWKGRYRLVAPLSPDGLWRGWDQELQRWVSLKFLHNVSDAARLLRRARWVATLDHPNIAKIHEVVEAAPSDDDAPPWPHIVTTFVEGETLKQAAATMPLAEKLRAVGRVVDVLRYAHERGVIHGDLRSNKVVVDRSGQVFVTELGLAGLDAGPIDSTVVVAPSHATLSRGHVRRDLNAVGAILYEILTGRIPAERNPPRVRKLVSSIPRDVEAVVLECMTTREGRGYRHATQALEDLDACLARKPLPHARRPRRLRFVWGLCALGLIAAISPLVRRPTKPPLPPATGHREEEPRRWRDELIANYSARAAEEGDIAAAALFLSYACELRPTPASGAAAAWGLASAPRLRGILRHDAEVLRLAVAPGGKYLATATARSVHFWNLETELCLARIDGLPEPTRFLGFVRGGTAIVGVDSKTIRFWSWPAGALLCKIEVEPVRSASLSANGKRLLVLGNDRVFVWDCDRGTHLASPPLEGGAGALNPEGRTLALASREGTVRLWDLDQDRPSGPLLRVPAPPEAVAFSPDGTSLAVTGEDRSIQMWNLHDGTSIRLPIRHRDRVRWMAFGPVLATSSGGAVLRVWDGASEWCLRHEGEVAAATFTEDGKRILTGGADATVKIWEPPRRSTLFVPHSQRVAGIAFNRDRSRAITTLADGSLRLSDPSSGRVICRIARIRHAVFTPDGSRFVALGAGAIRVGSAENGEIERSIELAQGAEAPPAFRADGKRWVMAISESIAEIRDWDSGERIGRPLRHPSAMRALAFGPDGRFVATGTEDGQVRLWDAESGERVRAPFVVGTPIRTLEFGPTLVAIGPRGGAAIVDVGFLLDRTPPAAARRKAEVHTGLHLDEEGELRALSEAEWRDRRRRLGALP